MLAKFVVGGAISGSGSVSVSKGWKWFSDTKSWMCVARQSSMWAGPTSSQAQCTAGVDPDTDSDPDAERNQDQTDHHWLQTTPYSVPEPLNIIKISMPATVQIREGAKPSKCRVLASCVAHAQKEGCKRQAASGQTSR